MQASLSINMSCPTNYESELFRTLWCMYQV